MIINGYLAFGLYDFSFLILASRRVLGLKCLFIRFLMIAVYYFTMLSALEVIILLSCFFIYMNDYERVVAHDNIVHL